MPACRQPPPHDAEGTQGVASVSVQMEHEGALRVDEG